MFRCFLFLKKEGILPLNVTIGLYLSVAYSIYPPTGNPSQVPYVLFEGVNLTSSEPLVGSEGTLYYNVTGIARGMQIDVLNMLAKDLNFTYTLIKVRRIREPRML